MKKLFYFAAALAIATSLTSCNSNDNPTPEDLAERLEVRAVALGYENSADYEASVAAQCAAGNHENCDVFADGTHQPCAYTEHSGTHHNGSHHDGTDHGTHNGKGHSHQSHNNKDKGNHGGNHH